MLVLLKIKRFVFACVILHGTTQILEKSFSKFVLKNYNYISFYLLKEFVLLMDPYFEPLLKVSCPFFVGCATLYESRQL